jgi:hypothetical protein
MDRMRLARVTVKWRLADWTSVIYLLRGLLKFGNNLQSKPEIQELIVWHRCIDA